MGTKKFRYAYKFFLFRFVIKQGHDLEMINSN